jgi:hypothetical protein
VEELLAPLNPNENALHDLFQSNVDETMLQEIAAADYGCEADECYAMLQPVLATGQVPDDEFQLREVLELISWSEPEDPAWRPGGQGRRGHWMRLFACVALVRQAARYRPSEGHETDTLAQFTASAIFLGPAVARASASLFAWRFLNGLRGSDTGAFLAFAILLLAAYLERGADRGPWLKELADWVESEESRTRDRFSKHEWLFGVTYHQQREAVWRSLAHRILVNPELPHPPEADQALRLLGALVAERL